jgi:hypothetical protein
MLLVMCCYGTSMPLLAPSISLRMLNDRERKECEETVDHTWVEVNNEVHTF